MSPTPDDGDDGPNVGGIVGGVIGATAGVMCMIIGVISVTYWRYTMHIQQYNGVVSTCIMCKVYMCVYICMHVTCLPVSDSASTSVSLSCLC